MRPYAIDALPQEIPDVKRFETLTIVPAHLKAADLTFLLGDNPDSIVHALFTTINGSIELKYLGFTISQYLERLMSRCEALAEIREKCYQAMEAMSAYSSESDVSD